jgi:hypothetical protein
MALAEQAGLSELIGQRVGFELGPVPSAAMKVWLTVLVLVGRRH